MAFAERFEDLVVWQKARAFNAIIYRLSSDTLFAKDFSFRDQIRRASVSISANIAEGFERNGRKEFNYFLSVAKASAGEVRSLLYVAFDLNYLNQADFDKLINEISLISKMISSLIKTLSVNEKPKINQ